MKPEIFWGYNSKEEALECWSGFIISIVEFNGGWINLGGQIHKIEWRNTK